MTEIQKNLGRVWTSVFVKKKKSRLSCLKEQDWKHKRKRKYKKEDRTKKFYKKGWTNENGVSSKKKKINEK